MKEVLVGAPVTQQLLQEVADDMEEEVEHYLQQRRAAVASLHAAVLPTAAIYGTDGDGEQGAASPAAGKKKKKAHGAFSNWGMTVIGESVRKVGGRCCLAHVVAECSVQRERRRNLEGPTLRLCWRSIDGDCSGGRERGRRRRRRRRELRVSPQEGQGDDHHAQAQGRAGRAQGAVSAAASWRPLMPFHWQNENESPYAAATAGKRKAQAAAAQHQ